MLSHIFKFSAKSEIYSSPSICSHDFNPILVSEIMLSSMSGGIKMVKMENDSKISYLHKEGAHGSIKSLLIRDITMTYIKFDKGNITFSKMRNSRELIK